MAERDVETRVQAATEWALDTYGVKPFSIVGGQRLTNIVQSAVRHALSDSPGELQYHDGDWAFDIDEESGEEAVWIDLQLFDPDDPDPSVRHVNAVLTLSDVELRGLVEAGQEILAESRRRFA
jgi:hypothetical protein